MVRGTALAAILTAGFGLALACGGGKGTSPVSITDTSATPPAEGSRAGRKALSERPEIADATNLTAEEVDALARWLAPMVAEQGGGTFTTLPKGELGTPENLADVMETEQTEILGRIYTELPPSVLEKMVQSARRGVPGLLGKYASSTGSVYLVPAGIAAMSQGLEGEVEPIDVATLIMAHELGHALQDQMADLDRGFGTLQDMDHFDGMRGITEGQANWITLRVARELGLEDAFWALSKGQGWGKDGLEQPGAFNIWMLYGQGMAFSDHHAQLGGTDRLWELVKAPPRSTTMLFRPETYGAEVRRPAEVNRALVDVEDTLTRSNSWVVADTNLGEGVLRAELMGLEDEARVDRLLQSIVWGHRRSMYVPSGGDVRPRTAELMLVRFASPADAQGFVDLLSDGLQSQADARTEMERQMAEAFGRTPRTWEVEAKPYDRVEGDRVIRRVVGATYASGARSSSDEEQALWVVRGDLLVVVGVAGFRPGNRLDKAVQQLFAQVEATDLSLPAEADTDSAAP